VPAGIRAQARPESVLKWLRNTHFTALHAPDRFAAQEGAVFVICATKLAVA